VFISPQPTSLFYLLLDSHSLIYDVNDVNDIILVYCTVRVVSSLIFFIFFYQLSYANV
jgi:hypothetical protein